MYLPLNSGRSSEKKIWEYKSQVVPGTFMKLFPEKVANADRCQMLTFYFKSMDNVRLLEILGHFRANYDMMIWRKKYSLVPVEVKLLQVQEGHWSNVAQQGVTPGA